MSDNSIANKKSLDFPIEEYRERLKRTQAEMAKHNLDALLLHQPENIRYLSGFFTGGYFTYQALLVPAEGDPILAIRDMEVAAAKATSWVTTWTTYADNKDPLPAAIAVATNAIEQAGLSESTIGVDMHSWFLTPERFEELKRQCPHVKFVAEPQIIDHLRIIKSAREIEYIRRAAVAVSNGINEGFKVARSGISERQLAIATVTGIASAGGMSPMDDNLIILSGERMLETHGHYTDRVIQKGDNVYLELTANINWYIARNMRTAISGKATDEQKRIAETIIAIQDKGISQMRPGVVAGDVDRTFREGVLNSGIRDTYTNRTAYSLGLNVYPSAGEFIRELVPGTPWVFEPGMVFHVLMMVKGIGFSETVLITENGPEILTNTERKLLIVD